MLRDTMEGHRQELLDMVKRLGEITGTKHDCRILDVADSASLNEMRRRAASLTSQHETSIGEINAAIMRMDDGRYGFSEKTGEPIDIERLKIVPWARTGAAD